MDALLTSLHALSLLPPSPSQLLQLLSNGSNQQEEDKEVRDLARVLSLGSYDPDEDTKADADAGTGGGGGFGIDRELIEDAVVEMIRTFKKDVAKCKDAFEAEKQQMESSESILMPKPTPLKFLKLRHGSTLRQTEKVSSLYGGYRPRIIFSGGPSFASSHDFADLQPASSGSLTLSRRLHGQYVVGKVASSISIYVGALLLVTLPEPFGFSLPIAISHFVRDPSMTSQDASRLLPEGTLIAVKEPYLSSHCAMRACGVSGGVGFRVDTPTDVVVLPADAEWAHKYTGDLKWVAEPEPPAKGKASKKNGKEKLDQSVEQNANHVPPVATWFAEGASSSSSSSQSLMATIRSLLADERPGAAWRLFTAKKSDLPASSETLELQGDILLALEHWESALQAYTSANLPTNMQQASELLRQSHQGPSPDGSTVSQIYTSHLSSSAPRIQVADWLSSALKVSPIPNAGRGLVTTRDVGAGETLLMARSRGSSYPSDAGLENCPIVRIDFQNGVLSTTTQVMATTNLIHAMVDRPELAQEIMGLTAGPNMEDSTWVKADQFQKAVAPLEPQWSTQEGHSLGPQGGINSLYVDEVLRHNAFGPGLVSRGDADDEGHKPSDTTSSTRKWPRALHRKLTHDPPNPFSRSTQPHPLPAILNHSCLPNVSSIFLGDVVITKALRPLTAGEEISHEYVRGGTDYQTRQSLLSKHGFVCACCLCQLDRGDGEDKLSKRRTIFAVQTPAVFARSDALLRFSGDSDGNAENHADIREALLDLVQQLDLTYDASRPALRPEMREILERIGRHALLGGKVHMGIKVSRWQEQACFIEAPG